MEQNEMFRTETVFDANKFDIFGAYLISFSMEPINRDEIFGIFNEYVRNAICSGMHDDARCMPKNRIQHRSGDYDEDWYDVEAILIGVNPKELVFMVPYFAEIKTKEHNDAWCNMPIMKIPIEAFMDNELRGAPVRIHRMSWQKSGGGFKWK